VPPTKGAKKPILSSEFRNRIQVDLIDMRAMRKRDIYGNMQRWIMTVKDHSTAGVFLCAPTEEGHFCCCRIGEIFWLNWLSQNLSHRYVYLYLHVKPISLFYFCSTDCIIYIFVLLFQFRQWEGVHCDSCC